jgi:N4-gp56 family major capsid protein
MLKYLLLTLNLQLFANHVNVTTDDGTAAPYNDLSPEMKTFYDMTLIDEAQANLVHDQFGQKRPIPKGGGKTIEFRKFAPLNKALTPLTEGVTPDGNNLTVTAMTATVAQYGDYITQSDVLELTALDNTILEATKLLGRQAGLTLDTVTRNVLQSGTNVSFAPKKDASNNEVPVTMRSDLDSTSVLTVDLINQIVAKLRAVNAPTINGDYVAIIHPYVAYDIMRDPEWIDSHKYEVPDNLYEGEIGKIGGVRFVQSTEAKIYAAEGPEYDLASDSHTLLINNASGYTGAITSVAFDGGTVAAGALVGKYISINGVCALVTANTATTITFASTDFGQIADNTVINPAECLGGAVFGSLFLADGAYGITEITGGGLQTIVKQKGSAGTADPLDQRSSVGWKAIKTAKILIGDYLVRVESCSPRFSKSAQAN